MVALAPTPHPPSAGSGFSRSAAGDISGLVTGAAAGDQRAWALLVGRFDRPIRCVARRYRLSPTDCDDVAQRTWLALVLHIGQIHDSAALGGWLITTAQRECLKTLDRGRREIPLDPVAAADRPDHVGVEDRALAAERRWALRRAISRAPAHERRLVQLLLENPAMSYDEVSSVLGIPKGSIGPTRGRCIARLAGDRQLAGVVG
jgi:RNA polymerase sigma factor (sigma-70 family)